MYRHLCTLPLPGSLSTRLQELGFVYCDDVGSYRNGQFSLDSTAEEVLRQWCSDPCKYWRELVAIPSSKNALTLLQDECALGGIETFCRSLDEFMDGGVPLQRITEFSGAPGSGKTQLCHQLSVCVQIPRAFHGLEGQAIYFDTCNGFAMSRLSDIAEGCVNHCTMVAESTNDQAMLLAMNTFSKNSVLQNVFHMLCLNYLDLIASLIYMRTFLKENKQVRLIIVDSITFPLNNTESSLHKVKQIHELLENLRTIAYEFNVAVVITNNLTTRIDSDKKTSLVPALGESFGHCIHYRFMLGRLSQNNFICVSGKNPNKPSTTISFQITKSGIREVACLVHSLK